MSGKENREQGSAHSALVRCTVDEGTVHSSNAEVNAEIPRNHGEKDATYDQEKSETVASE